jgi:hypothetical protein
VAECSKEGCGSKRAVLPMMMMNMGRSGSRYFLGTMMKDASFLKLRRWNHLLLFQRPLFDRHSPRHNRVIQLTERSTISRNNDDEQRKEEIDQEIDTLEL